MTAAALFEIKLLSTAINRIVALRTPTGGKNALAAMSSLAMNAAPPVVTSAMINAKLGTVSKINDESSTRVA